MWSWLLASTRSIATGNAVYFLWILYNAIKEGRGMLALSSLFGTSDCCFSSWNFSCFVEAKEHPE